MKFNSGRDTSVGSNNNGHTSFNEEFWNAQSEEYGVETDDIAASPECVGTRYRRGSERRPGDALPARVVRRREHQKASHQFEVSRTSHVKVDMSRIDRLLTIDSLSDEEDIGAEVFKMLDRFNSAVNQFGDEYAAACDEREREIAEANVEAKSLRDRIEQEHNAKSENITREKEEAIENLEKQLQEAITDRQRKLQTATNEFARFRTTTEEKLKKLHFDNKAKSNIIKTSVLDKVVGYYELVRELVSRKIAYAMEEAMGRVSRKKLTVEQMRRFTSEKCTEEAKSLYDAIYVECQKIIRRRLPELCEQLAVLCCQAKRAYRAMLVENEREEKEARDKYEADVAKREENLEQIKKVNRSEDERQQRDTDLQKSQIESSSKARVIDEKVRYEDAKKATNETLQAQEMERSHRWFKDLANQKSSFYQKMEVVFPVARMKALFDKLEMLVKYLDKPFNLGDEPRHFIAIGRAKVVFADPVRMNSEAYNIIQDWIKKTYQFMQGNPKDLRKLVVPYIISVDRGTALLLKHKDQYEDKVKELINGIGIRMLWSVPASLQEFCLIDTAAIGSYAPLQYMDPAQNPDAAGELIKSMIVGGKVFQKKDEMARQIDEMRTSFESRKGSMGSFKTLREYNSAYFMSREAYQAAIIQHFPMNLEADSVMDITTMARDCRTAGFSTILAMPETSESYMEDQVKLRVRDLESHVTVLQMRDNGSFMIVSNCQSEAEKSAEIMLFPSPSNTKLTEMRASFFEASMNALKVAVDFNIVAPEEQMRFQDSSSQGLVIPLGLMRGGTKFELRMDDVHIHTILSGVTGAGKSNLLHVLLLSIMLRYSPDEVEIYLIDFKHGVDFGVYSNYHLPNFRVLSITSEVEFPLAALEEVENEFDRRAYEFELKGALNIAEYNRMNPKERMKRIVLILDEMYVLMRDPAKDGNRYIAEKIMQIIDKIAHSSRAFGIHMLISGQDITKIDGIENIINQCANRIVMYSSNEDVKTLLGDGDASALMHEIKPSSQGTCVFSNGSTAKLAYTARNESISQHKLLADISKHYTDLREETNVRILLTEPSKSKYHPFRRFVDDGALPENDPEKSPDKVQLFIGEPLTLLKDFNYYPDKNLWILGGDSTVAEMAGYGVMFSCLLSLLFGKLKAKEEVREFDILCADGSDDRTGDIDRNDRFWQFCDSLMDQGNMIQYVAGNELSQHIRRLKDIIMSRKEGDDANYPIWFLISKIEECYGVPDQDKMALRKILDDGPKKGIHTILWTKDALFAKQFHLSDAPCDKLILETADLEGFGVKIKQNIATGYKAQMLWARGGVRLRLYDLPVHPWVERILQRFDQL